MVYKFPKDFNMKITYKQNSELIIFWCDAAMLEQHSNWFGCIEGCFVRCMEWYSIGTGILNSINPSNFFVCVCDNTLELVHILYFLEERRHEKSMHFEI